MAGTVFVFPANLEILVERRHFKLDRLQDLYHCPSEILLIVFVHSVI